MIDPLPDVEAVVLLYAWNWDLSERLREQLKRWVAAGGRLVIDASLQRSQDFELWSGIVQTQVPRSKSPDAASEKPAVPKVLRSLGLTPMEGCAELRLELAAGEGQQRSRWMACDFLTELSLRTERPVQLELRDDNGAQLLRTGIGLGSVTVVNRGAFAGRELLIADHTLLYGLMLQLHAGDRVVIINGNSRSSLPGLIWSRAAPLVVLGTLALLLFLWRISIRFGPLQPAPSEARRSLRQQISGTAGFLIRSGGSLQLWQASLVALDQAIATRLPMPPAPSAAQRMMAVVRLTGLPESRIAEALGMNGDVRAERCVRAIHMIESLRRRIRPLESAIGN